MDRSELMSRIRSRNTRQEIRVRRLLWHNKFRYRKNFRIKRYEIDIAFIGLKIAIFLNGCFWHGHECYTKYMPKSNTDFWTKKINKNKERDDRRYKYLKKMVGR